MRILRISVDGESIVATDLQRFWISGKGWTMARDLKAGDRLRIVGGVAEVTSIEKVSPQPVYNVDVAKQSDLFVGVKGFLVYDSGFVPAVPEPFDWHPGLSTSAPATPAKPPRSQALGAARSRAAERSENPRTGATKP